MRPFFWQAGPVQLPAFTRPGLAVSDDGDGSVTATITGNLLSGGSDQTSRLKYRKADAAGWTVHGTSITGNGTITDLTGLDYDTNYHFQLVPFDSVTSGEGEGSTVVLLYMQDSSVSEPTSTNEDQITSRLAHRFDIMAKAVVYTLYGGSPASITAIVHDQGEDFTIGGTDDMDALRKQFTTKKTDTPTPNERDTFTYKGLEWAVVRRPAESGGVIRFDTERKSQVRTAARDTRGL